MVILERNSNTSSKLQDTKIQRTKTGKEVLEFGLEPNSTPQNRLGELFKPYKDYIGRNRLIR